MGIGAVDTGYQAIARARAAYAPTAHLQLLDDAGREQLLVAPADAARVRDAVAGFVDEVGAGSLEIVTNRRSFGVLEMLRSGEPLRTGSLRTGEMLESRLGIRAPGETHIVNYALMYPPSPALDALAGAAVVNGGPDGYGQVAAVLKSDVFARMTMTNGDSGGTTGLYPPEALADAIAGAVIRRAAGLERAAAHNEHAVAHDPALLAQLLGDDTGQVARGLIATIPETTGGTRGVPAMPEVQVYGGIRPQDVREIRVQDGAPPGAIAALREAAEPHGITVTDAVPMTPEARMRWARETEGAPTDWALVQREWDDIRTRWHEVSTTWDEA